MPTPLNSPTTARCGTGRAWKAGAEVRSGQDRATPGYGWSIKELPTRARRSRPEPAVLYRRLKCPIADWFSASLDQIGIDPLAWKAVQGGRPCNVVPTVGGQNVALPCYTDSRPLRRSTIMSTTTIRLPSELKARVAAAAKKAGKSAHSFILEAIAEKAQDTEQASEFQALAD